MARALLTYLWIKYPELNDLGDLWLCESKHLLPFGDSRGFLSLQGAPMRGAIHWKISGSTVVHVEWVDRGIMGFTSAFTGCLPDFQCYQRLNRQLPFYERRKMAMNDLLPLFTYLRQKVQKTSLRLSEIG